MDYKERLHDVKRFYELITKQEIRIGGKRFLDNPDAKKGLPNNGVYFFFEPNEMRTTSGGGQRVVRVGTHGIEGRSKANLWSRLRAHRGNIKGRLPGGGNHRGSVFRRHLGAALIRRDGWQDPAFAMWGTGSSASRQTREQEYPLEHKVSKYIKSMPFLWVTIEDSERANNLKAYIEKNAIALLSNYNWKACPIDPPSTFWLGNFSDREAIRSSALWNIDHIFNNCDPEFINELGKIVS